MKYPLDEVFACVRQTVPPATAFNSLRDIGRAHFKSELWDAVPLPDSEADIAAAADWLKKSFADECPTGVYLGLDTNNQEEEWGHNVEIGLSDSADSSRLDMEWIFEGLDYGDNHLIRGLYEVYQAYAAFELDHPESLFPDYIFFLGYSGIVLAGAVERIRPKWDSLFVWGFHDGDMGYLVRTSERGVERVGQSG
ncbi:MAG TPA: hypothetical protein VFG04_29690 [Planctomycetaceae bacterium]|jgi:hypothetical protein|nr:hypothetical protein [Planctomycetaceae bacterium]